MDDTTNAHGVREDEFFLGPDNQTFATHHRAGGATFTIIVPPLFEEHARTRKVLVNIARTLAGAGIDCVRFDYPGTGLSAGTTEDLTLARAADALRAAVAYCHQLGATRVDLLGFRFGGYLAVTLANSIAPSRLVLWEPILDLAAYFDELLRVEMSNQMVSLGRVRRTREQLVDLLRAGHGVLIDGNRVGPALYREIAAARRLDVGRFDDRVRLLLWDSKALHDDARRAGLDSVLVDRVRFSWRHIRELEPRSDPLFLATLRAVAG